MTNGGMRLCLIDGTCKAFLRVRMNVLMLYGQLYATAASTIGTDSSLEQSLENGLTSQLLPDFPKTVAWPPATTMLAWESNCIVVGSLSSIPMLAVVAQTAEISPIS